MSKRFLALAIAVLLASVATTALGEETAPGAASENHLDVLLSTIRANRKALVAVNLNLSPEDAQKFWPLYEQYQTEVSAVGARIAALAKEYVDHFTDITDERALQLMTEYLDAEAERLKIRRNYIPEFAKVVSGRTVARFYQIENKIDAVLRYDLAATIPVVDDKR